MNIVIKKTNFFHHFRPFLFGERQNNNNNNNIYCSFFSLNNQSYFIHPLLLYPPSISNYYFFYILMDFFSYSIYSYPVFHHQLSWCRSLATYHTNFIIIYINHHVEFWSCLLCDCCNTNPKNVVFMTAAVTVVIQTQKIIIIPYHIHNITPTTHLYQLGIYYFVAFFTKKIPSQWSTK